MATIKAFILTFNEADIISFTIKHYQQFCSEIHIYDNYSTDSTRYICAAMGCVIHTFGQEGVLDDREYLKVKNNCWKEHRDADYVIVCDADEILDLPERFYKFELIRGAGYDMYSEKIPNNSWNEIDLGYRNLMYDKVVMFNPKLIKEINYRYGCHGCRPIQTRNLFIDNSRHSVLRHMRYIGGVDRMIARYDVYKKRMCDFNKVNNLGFQYLKSDEDIIKEWEEVKNKSILI